jgi:hypothetical protein
VTVGLAIDSGRPLPIRQGVELGLGSIDRSLNQLLGSRWRPQAICFTHAAPPAYAAKLGIVTVAKTKIRVMPVSRMFSAISFGVFCRTAPSTICSLTITR